jgi:hypothetical protein
LSEESSSPFIEPVVPPKKPLTGAERARLYRERHGAALRESNAERMRDARAEERKQRAEHEGIRVRYRGYNYWHTITVPYPEVLKKWNKALVKKKLGMNNGLFMAEADKGTGKLVTGGYTPVKCDLIRGIRETDTGRVKNKGCGDSTNMGKVGFNKHGASYIRGKELPTFHVYLRDDPKRWKRDKIVAGLVELCFTIIPATKTIVDADGNLVHERTPELYRCRVWNEDNELCRFETDWPNDRSQHIEEGHPELIDKPRYACRRIARG